MNLTIFAQDERLRARLATALDLGWAAGRAAAPVVDFLARVALAKAFFDPGMFAGIGATDFSMAWPMIVVQVIGPVLMAIGLLVRPVALLMLVLTLRAHFSDVAPGEHFAGSTIWLSGSGRHHGRRTAPELRPSTNRQRRSGGPVTT